MRFTTFLSGVSLIVSIAEVIAKSKAKTKKEKETSSPSSSEHVFKYISSLVKEIEPDCEVIRMNIHHHGDHRGMLDIKDIEQVRVVTRGNDYIWTPTEGLKIVY